MIEMQTTDVEKAGRALNDLRAGFTFSIVSIACLVASMSMVFLVYWGFLVSPVLSPVLYLGPVLYVTPIFYLYAVVERASGWKLLGFRGTRYTLLGCGAFIVVYPFLGLGQWLLVFYGAEELAWLVLLALWALYTCAENNSLRILGRNLGMNLKLARVFALIGILSAVMGYYFSHSYPIMFFCRSSQLCSRLPF